MGDETLEDGISVAAPFILAVVFAVHFFPWYFGRSFKFEQEAAGQDNKDSQPRLLFIIKVITYFILVCFYLFREISILGNWKPLE